jgi:hypothetical protein
MEFPVDVQSSLRISDRYNIQPVLHQAYCLPFCLFLYPGLSQLLVLNLYLSAFKSPPLYL